MLTNDANTIASGLCTEEFRVLRIDLTRLSALRCYEQDVDFTKSIWLHSLFFFHYK